MPAPPHDKTGHTWHHSDAGLFRRQRRASPPSLAATKSDMPAFGDVLAEEEILAVLAFIKSTWPERERGYQAEITRRDSGGGP